MPEEERNFPDNPYVFRFERKSEPSLTDTPNRLEVLRSMRQEALSAVALLDSYLERDTALLQPTDIEQLRNVLTNVPLNEGNILLPDSERKKRFQKNVVIVPVGGSIRTDEDRPTLATSLTQTAQEQGLRRDPIEYVSNEYTQLVGQVPLLAGESVVLHADALYGPESPLPSYLAFTNTTSGTPVGGASTFESTAYVVNQVLADLSQDFEVVSFPPMNIRADGSSLNIPEFLLSYAVGVLRSTKDSRQLLIQKADDPNASLPSLEVIELVVSPENFKRFEDYQKLLKEILQQKIERTQT